MKIKFFLRGLGTGIISTTLIFIIALALNPSDSNNDNKQKQTDSVLAYLNETTVQSTTSDNETVSQTEDKSDDNLTTTESESDEDDKSLPGKETLANGEIVTKTTSESTVKSDTASSIKNEQTTQIDLTNKVEVNIEPGSTATQIAQKLYDYGLIKDVKTFVSYMYEMDSTGKIQAGKHYIEIDSTYADILDNITQKNN